MQPETLPKPTKEESEKSKAPIRKRHFDGTIPVVVIKKRKYANTNN